MQVGFVLLAVSPSKRNNACTFLKPPIEIVSSQIVSDFKRKLVAF